jgi:hypothetical protein
LTKNLISIYALKDKGYEVSFRKGRVFVRPAGSSEKMNRMIEVREEKVYKLQFQPGRALVNTTRKYGRVVAQEDGALALWCIGALERGSHSIS